jgi:hypothetical protein
MSGREIGLFLRMLGPLIQIVCLILLFGSTGQGTARRGLLTAFFLLGLVLVMAGILLSRPRPGPAPPDESTDEDRFRL